MRLALVAFALLLAGCADTADPTPAPGNNTTMSTRDPITTTIPVSLAAAAPVNEPMDTQQGSFEVPEGANETFLEARYTCTSPTCAFWLQVANEGGEMQEQADPSTNANELRATLAPGSYLAQTRSGGPAANMEGEIRVTVFFGPIPEGFTAFEG